MADHTPYAFQYSISYIPLVKKHFHLISYVSLMQDVLKINKHKQP
jgi:hypothetical protein